MDYFIDMILKKQFNLKLKLQLYMAGEKKVESDCSRMAAVCMGSLLMSGVGVISLVDIGNKYACSGVVCLPKYMSLCSYLSISLLFHLSL